MGLLQDRIAVVTGASQGLGKAIAHRLAREGATVALVARREKLLQEVAEEIASHGGRATGYPTDVTDETQVERMVARVMETFGHLDILVANAGILQAYDITELPADVWRRVIEVNLTGYFLCAKHAARIMKEQRAGVIIHINSKSGKKGSFRNCAYAASKFGGIGLTQSIALDLAPYGVRVNAVCPGNLLDSPLWVGSLYEQFSRRLGMTREEVRRYYESQVPLGRGCTYEDVCNVVVFLASDQAA